MGKVFDLWVDEGHGGVDSGATGGGMQEDSRNLLLGNALAKYGKQQGWEIHRTRTTDVFVTLQDRYRRANKEDADAFVALHHDDKSGMQAVIYPNSNNARETTSKHLADHISSLIDALAPTKSITYADRRGLAVLRGTEMPAVIVEASRVQDKYSADLMAKAIVQGICNWHGVKFLEAGNRPPAPAPKPKPHASTHVFLRKGSDNATMVEHLQHLLNEHGAKLVVDGDFGPNTEKAVRAFQKKSHLDVDGLVGNDTWKALHK